MCDYGQKNSNINRNTGPSENSDLYPNSAKKLRRSQQNKESKKRTMDRGTVQIKNEAESAMNWCPYKCVPLPLEVGMQFAHRLQCNKAIRAYTAYNEV